MKDSGKSPRPAPSRRPLGASGGRHSGGKRLKANSGKDYQEVVTTKISSSKSFCGSRKIAPDSAEKTKAASKVEAVF
jgi:hypothetical protein